MKKANSRVSNSNCRMSNSMDSRVGNSMNNRMGSMSNKWSSSILRDTIISDISNISFITTCMIVHILGTSIRESNRVGSSDSSCTISRLSSIESRARVVISNCIGVSVGVWLIRVDWGMDSMSNHRVSKNRAMGNSNRVSYCMSKGMTKSMSK